MSERDGGYRHGVPCWVDTWQEDADAAVAFYAGIFGWEAEETSPPGAERRHFMCHLQGKIVAGIGSPPPMPGHTPVWGTYVKVDDVDATVAEAEKAGGKVAMGPFGALDGGRLAVLVDPTGAVIAAWQQDEHHGAEIVNAPGAWAMSALHTTDRAAALEFHSRIFGWKYESFEAGPGAEVTIALVSGYFGGTDSQPVSRETVAAIAGMPPGAGDEVPPHWGVNFWTDDCDGTVERAKELGGSVIQEPADAPPFRSAAIADPEGAVLAISELREY